MVARKMSSGYTHGGGGGGQIAPVCEAFIMTGETILKTYTNKSEIPRLQDAKRIVRAADTTTPGLANTSQQAQQVPVKNVNNIESNNNNNIISSIPKSLSASGAVQGKQEVAAAAAVEASAPAGRDHRESYIRHAQYRVAAALEQRAKSLSLSKLSEVNGGGGGVDGEVLSALPARCGEQWAAAAAAAAEANDSRRGFSRAREAAASWRVRVPVFPHAQQHEQQRRAALLSQMEQQGQGGPPAHHDHGDKLQNSAQTQPAGLSPDQPDETDPTTRCNQYCSNQVPPCKPDPTADHNLRQPPLQPLQGTNNESNKSSNSNNNNNIENGDTNATDKLKPTDCEHKYSIVRQVEQQTSNSKDKHKAQQRKQQMDQQQEQRQLRQQQPPTPVARTNTFIVTSRRQIKSDHLSKLNAGQRFDDDDFSIEFKTGFLNRKRVFDARGKPTSKGQRGWRRAYVILRDLRFIVRYGQHEKELEAAQDGGAEVQDKEGSNSSDPVAQKLENQSAKTRKQVAAKDLKNTIRLHHSFAKRSTSYTKREYVFHLQLADQSEWLLQASSETEMNSWIDTINFASACLSSPPLPSAVSSSNKRYQQSSRSRPILPASYTKLSYWEQLTDHEERLERLKSELEEHLNEAPVKRHANKRAKSEFIDKIAYLRQKIEHYTVYLDLMQKKSNSPEAIVLSKHPQIASLTPSKEMVRNLPLVNSKTHEDEDKKKDIR